MTDARTEEVPETTTDPPQFLGLLMSSAMRNHYVEIERLLHEHGYDDLRHADTVIFENITSKGDHVSDIARRSIVTKQAIAQAVDRLERLGYVERHDDPDDGRAKIVRLSRKGKRAAATAGSLLREMETRLTAEVGEDTIETFRSVLEIIAGHRYHLAGPTKAR